MDQIFVIRQLSKKFLQKNRTLYNNLSTTNKHLIVCGSQAYDKYCGIMVYQKLVNSDITRGCIYSKTLSAVRVDGKLSGFELQWE